jgi:hypothetical protein
MLCLDSRISVAAFFFWLVSNFDRPFLNLFVFDLTEADPETVLCVLRVGDCSLKRSRSPSYIYCSSLFLPIANLGLVGMMLTSCSHHVYVEHPVGVLGLWASVDITVLGG